MQSLLFPIMNGRKVYMAIIHGTFVSTGTHTSIIKNQGYAMLSYQSPISLR